MAEGSVDSRNTEYTESAVIPNSPNSMEGIKEIKSIKSINSIKSIEQMDFYALLKENFALPDTELKSYSPLTLAYIGDGIYDLVIRSVVVGRGNTKPGKLHHRTSRIVKAEAQSAMMNILLPLLTEEEKHVYKRGRNAKSQTVSRHASVTDYRRATGFEALMGYLYLKGETKRLLFLIGSALDAYEEHADYENRQQ